MNLAKVNLDEIEWFGKTKIRAVDDISCSCGKNDTVNFVIKKEIAEVITTTGYIEIGTLGAALIFKESTLSKGYKLSKNKNADTVKLCLGKPSKNILEWAKKYSGNYQAKLFREWVYIDAESNNK